jgi:hypothetical protein
LRWQEHFDEKISALSYAVTAALVEFNIKAQTVDLIDCRATTGFPAKY